jgi:multidrug efflux system membrane fusion protein
VYEIRALGSLEAPERVQVVAEVEGAVSEVLFNEGLHASPKTVLARIDPERFRLAAEQAEAVLRQAESDSDRAKADLARREALAKEELLSVEELNRVRAETGRLRAVAEAARAARDIALQNRTRSEVRAPGGGVIDTRTVDTGQYVRMGTVLATLVDTSRLRLRCKVSDAESMRAAVGQDVSFRIAALGSRDFPARIYHVGSVADPATRQVEVLAWAPNPGLLRPGFFAEVRLAAESHKGATVVSESAVLATDAGFVAYVVEKGKASLRKVEIGLRTGDGNVEILSGLAPGDTVIVEGSDRLADGVPVVTGSTEEEAKK